MTSSLGKEVVMGCKFSPSGRNVADYRSIHVVCYEIVHSFEHVEVAHQANYLDENLDNRANNSCFKSEFGHCLKFARKKSIKSLNWFLL